MPSIAQSKLLGARLVEGGVIQPTAAPPRNSEAPPLPPIFPQAPSFYLRGPLPAAMVQQPDTQRTFANIALPQSRVSPAPTTSSPVAGAQAQSQVVVVQGSSEGLTLEVNGTKTAKQTLLNLIAGTGMELSADSQGGVTVTSTNSGDGLTHSADPWEADPAYIIFRDDFSPYAGGIQQSTTGIGQLGWDLAIHASWANNSPAYVGGAFPANGVYSLPSSDSAANLYNCLIWPSSATTSAIYDTMSAWPLFDYPGWKLTWVFSMDSANSFAASFASSLPHTSTYIGLCVPWATDGWGPATDGVRPPTFVGLRFDTDTTAPSIADATFHFEAVANPNYSAASRNNTQGTVVDTGIAPTAHTWYRLEIACVQAGQATLTLFGGSATATATLTVPKISAVSGVGGQTLSSESANGTGVIYIYTAPLASPGQNPSFAMGSKITVSGVTGTHSTNWNSNFTLVRSNGALFFDAGGTDIAFSWNSGAEVTGYSAYVPFITFGNSSTAPNGYLALQVDFFSFVWNPNLSSGAPGAPNPTKARYW